MDRFRVIQGKGIHFVIQPLDEGWFAVYHIDERGIRHIAIQPSPDPESKSMATERAELSARAVRRIVPRSALAAVRQQIVRRAGRQVDLPPLTPSMPKKLKRAVIAALYVDAMDHGSRSPNEDVAPKVGLDPEQVRDSVSDARRDGLLSPAPGRGRAGGRLTGKAFALLPTPEVAAGVGEAFNALVKTS